MKCNEISAKYFAEFHNLAMESHAFENKCYRRKLHIQTLWPMLRNITTALQTRKEIEETKNKVQDLQHSLVEAKRRILDNKKIQKELLNTILELKGKIRVFCRV